MKKQSYKPQPVRRAYIPKIGTDKMRPLGIPDDSVFCFQYEGEAQEFYKLLKQRLAEFKLEVAEDKTKIIRFGRFAEENIKNSGKRKPETFDFLGFTHYCSKSERGNFRVKRRTSKKKYNASLKRCKQWLKNSITTPTV